MSKFRGETLNKHRAKPDKTKNEFVKTPSDSFIDGQCRR